MWPHKRGLGVQLSYGVRGNGILSLEDTGEVKVSFPRANQPQLGKLSTKSTCIVKCQINHNDKDTSSSSKQASDGVVPSKMLRILQSASQTLNSVSAYDPTYGRTLAFFYTRNSRSNHRRLRAVAYAAGKQGAHLAISLVVPLNKPDPVNPGIDSPVFLTPVVLGLAEPVKQIAVFDGHKSQHDFLLVRTQSKIYVLHCLAKNDLQTPELQLVGEVTSGALRQLPLVDVSWDSEDYCKFHMVDSKGNIAKASIDDNFDIKVEIVEAEHAQLITASEVFELSNWRRICKVGKTSYFIASRSSLVRLDIRTSSTERIITSETWSRIQDLHILSQEEMLLLTSKEIIWVDIKDKPTRILSWKHFWDNNDPSLKLEVNTIENEYYCLLYSEASPLAICISFGYIDGRPSCLTSPSIIHLDGSKTPIHCLSLCSLDDVFFSYSRSKKRKHSKPTPVLALFDCRVNLEVNFISIGFHLPMAMSVEDVLDFKKISKSIKQTSVRPFSGVLFPHLDSKSLRHLISDINTNLGSTNDGVHAIQEFAFRLGEGSDRLKAQIDARKKLEKTSDASYVSVLDTSDTIPSHVSQVEEFDVMFEQLKRFNKENGIELKTIIEHFLEGSEVLKSSPTASIKGIAEYLENLPIQRHNKRDSWKEVALLLFSSLTKARPNDLMEYYERKLTEEVEMASTNTKAIVNSWNASDEILTLVDDFSTHVDNYEPVTSSLPTINIASQDVSALNRPSKRSKKVPLRKSVLLGSQNTQTSTTLSSSEVYPSQGTPISLSRPSSQPRTSQSSQRFKKKKKRGFA